MLEERAYLLLKESYQTWLVTNPCLRLCINGKRLCIWTARACCLCLQLQSVWPHGSPNTQFVNTQFLCHLYLRHPVPKQAACCRNRFLDSGGVYKLAFGPKAFIVVSDPVVVRHLLKVRRKNHASAYDQQSLGNGCLSACLAALASGCFKHIKPLF